MKIVIPREIAPDERRVALVPALTDLLIKMGFEVHLEAGAGEKAFFPDAAYQDAGAQIVSSVEDLYRDAKIVLKVRPPMLNKERNSHEIDLIPKSAVLIGFLETLRVPETAELLAKRGVTSFSMDTIPRISRAQSMDALSSQASAAGYKAVLIAAEVAHKFFPMLTTAAGTIPPAKVFVIGAGVAGLQAIATAHRLGATVEGFDIRPAAKGEVESLGAKFVQVELEEETEAEGGYAKEVTAEAERKEQEVIHQHVAAADVVITTAQVPGAKAPVLVNRGMVEAMKPGSVIVDLAVEQGGNCELSEPGVNVEHNGVTVIGRVNLPSALSVHSSQMYCRNLLALLGLLVKEGELNLNFEDEIVKGCCITHDGAVVHERTAELINKK